MYRLNDVDFMREALRLAAEGTGLASPNPRVGAVVVREGQIVGRGVHLYERRDHAERVALAEAGGAARGATLYVNLEPCSHTGRTPPCAAAIVETGVARVVAAMPDPNPKVAGEGLRQLAAAGIAVETGCLEREARRLNEDFACWIRTGRPFVTLKAALSLDGRLALRAEHAPRWISSLPSRERVQHMRHERDAVLTGIGTALADDPQLTDRSKRPRRRPLLRVVLDRDLRLPPSARLAKSSRRQQDVLVMHGPLGPEAARRRSLLEKAGVRLREVAATAEGISLPEALAALGQEEILSVLLEGGARLNGAMLAAGLVDKMLLFQAPLLLGDGGLPLASGLWAPLPRRPLGPLSCETVGPDVMIETYFTD